MKILRNDEIQLLRTGEIADTRVRHIGGLVSRHHVVPDTHFTFRSPPLFLRASVFCSNRNSRALAAAARSTLLLAFSLFSNSPTG